MTQSENAIIVFNAVEISNSEGNEGLTAVHMKALIFVICLVNTNVFYFAVHVEAIIIVDLSLKQFLEPFVP